MSKATPGPWEVIEHSWSHTGIYAGDKAIAGLNIVDEATEENEAELGAVMLANARLMAAAPDLLAALQVLFAEYKELADSGDAGFWKLEESATGKQALAAIAKATGE